MMMKFNPFALFRRWRAWRTHRRNRANILKLLAEQENEIVRMYIGLAEAYRKVVGDNTPE